MPLTAPTQDIANFLLIRGPYAFLGHGWLGCSREYQVPEQINWDYGEPVGLCKETAVRESIYCFPPRICSRTLLVLRHNHCSLGVAACYCLVMLTVALLMTSSHSEGQLEHLHPGVDQSVGVDGLQHVDSDHHNEEVSGHRMGRSRAGFHARAHMRFSLGCLSFVWFKHKRLRLVLSRSTLTLVCTNKRLRLLVLCS